VVGEAGKRRSGWSIFRRILREVRGYRWSFAGIASLGALSAPLAVLAPLAMMIFIDCQVDNKPLPGVLTAVLPASLISKPGPLIIAVGLLLLAALLTQALNFVKGLLRVYTKERLVLGFRTRLFGHVERLSLSYHDEKGPSEATFRVLMDTAVIPAILLDGMIPMLQSLVLLLVMGGIILTLSWKLAVVAVAVAPVMLLISWPFGKSLRRQWHGIKELDSQALSVLQEVFGAVRVIKAFGQEDLETGRLQGIAERGIAARIKVTKTQHWFNSFNALLTAIGMAAFMIVGAWQLAANALTLGQLAAVAVLMVQFYSPLQQLVGTIAGLQSALASAERVLTLLDEAPEVIERPGARELGRSKGAVAFQNVAFEYEPDQIVLHDISFQVEPGLRIGIAGPTGAGKTTLMSLLTRLYDPGSGAILLDDIDLRDIKIKDLRRQFAVVLQEPVLFRKSIAQNINYAQPGATMEQTIEAAKLANAHDFIMATRDGYDTIVGERGMRMSGGERQRISLARAFLKDAPILILDEPTSSVDMRTEAQIMEASQRLMKGRTTFIIAHRPSTLQICDKVLVIDKGRVVAFAAPNSVGSLDELMLTTARTTTPKPKGVA
jgi:ATP-binding cassette subfamily B protein